MSVRNVNTGWWLQLSLALTTAAILLTGCASTGGEDAAERACTAAMPEVLGTDRDGLTRRWLERLDRLAG